jgi:hypothetical protein
MDLESAKAHVGIPVNIGHYVIWLHCWHYSDVCKDSALLPISPSARMFFKDEQKEIAQRNAKQNSKRKAMANYLTIADNRDELNELLILLCVQKDLPYQKVLQKGNTEIDIFITDIVVKEPELFNTVFNDVNRRLRALVERAIAAKILLKSAINQRVSTVEGRELGANMTDVLAFLKHPANKEELAKINARLNN